MNYKKSAGQGSRDKKMRNVKKVGTEEEKSP